MIGLADRTGLQENKRHAEYNSLSFFFFEQEEMVAVKYSLDFKP
jgi:hypothetical protein